MSHTPFQEITYEANQNIATITLNRPDKMNAFTPRMCNESIEALDLADADDEVRVIIFTGEGRAFCAGADISPSDGSNPFIADNAAKNEDGSIDYNDESVRDFGGLLTLRLYRSNKPVIAAINGAAVGVGATMTLAMDIRIASDKSKFGFVFARRGIVPESASAWFLPQIVGRAKALEWSLTGNIFDAEEALNGGLISSIHSPESLLEAAYKIARNIADNTAPVSIALTRHMLWRAPCADHPMFSHQLDSRGVYSRSKSKDAREGIDSFLEKRDPHYPDKVSEDMPDFFPWWTEPEYAKGPF